MISCEVCGNSNIVKQDGIFMCQSCGIRYSLDEIKKLLQVSNKENQLSESIRVPVSVGDIVFYGSYRFYVDDIEDYPIEWIVIEENDESFVLLSRYLIDFVQYNTFQAKRTDIPEILDSKGGYRYVWHNSSLRKWLNSTFFDEAFDDDEKEGIINKHIKFPQYTIIDMSEYPNSSESLPDTYDNVYIPSDKDLLTYIRAIRVALMFTNIEITPFAKEKASSLDRSDDVDYWGRNQSLLSRRNNARLVGNYGHVGERKASEYAYLRPMITVKKKTVQNLINDYDNDFYTYYLRVRSEYLEVNKEGRDFCKSKDIEEIVAKSELSIEHYEEIQMESEVTTETSLCENAYDVYEEENSCFDMQKILEETWRETHLNPYGTEDVGDGYIDSDGVFTEY